MSLSDVSLHPRPQQARAQWVDLCGEWQFAYDDTAVGVDERWYRLEHVFDQTITVPFPPESSASGIGDTSFHPVVWYRRTFSVPRTFNGKRIFLHFGAVDYRAQVWVNGSQVVSHEGGQTPFYADITGIAEPGEDITVVVRAEDPPGDLEMPRGKQDWREHPHAIWYHRTTGIWQPVWLEAAGSPFITDLRWTPDLTNSTLELDLTLSPHNHPVVDVSVTLSLRGELLAEDLIRVRGTQLHRAFALDRGDAAMERGRCVWSPGQPNLIEAEIAVTVDGVRTDLMQSYAGLRSVGTSGGRFLLNGEPYFLRLALEQGYWSDSHLAAPGDDALRFEVERAKALGFNGVRIHQKVEDPRFLYWCDRLGLLVWGEMANPYVFSPTSTRRMTTEWLEVLRRDVSHPCIVTWVPVNESWGVPGLLGDEAQQNFVRAMYALTRAYDSSRPCIGNDGWEFVAGDMLGIHDYNLDPAVLRARYDSTAAIATTVAEAQPSTHFVHISGAVEGLPVVLSEFGGISFSPAPDADWFGYGTVDGAEAFADAYRGLVEAALSCAGLSGFCYTQLTDTLQETNGLLTAEREFKIDPEVIRSVNLGTVSRARNAPIAPIPSPVKTS
jgi:beta-galactosidase/beta-glucuronidase